MGQNSAEASLVRTIARGEKVADIVKEGAQLTYASGNEVALVKLASGERALVMGGPGESRLRICRSRESSDIVIGLNSG
jgi:hypothetical protein